VAVIILAESAERRPHQVTVVRRWPEIAVEDELPVLLGDMKLIRIGIEDFDAVLRALGERRAMPGIFLRAVFARLRQSGPAWHFELGAPRLQSGIHQPIFDLLHCGHPDQVLRVRFHKSRVAGFADVAKTDPDGPTVLVSSTSMGTGQVLRGSLPTIP